MTVGTFTVSHTTHHLIDSNGGLARGLSTKQVPAFLVHQCNEACLSLLAHHGIRFPVATDGTVRCTGRTLFNGVRYDELATMFVVAFLVTPFPVMDLPSARKKSIFSRSNGVRCV